ncbi:hypothetical protein [Flavobacterium sp. '19STA2R22 D10 B1']|uniref:hypothetical protein n=1 Tax=Flavobacterium aerium TaxID=3037261 RepID=UPI00278C8BC0|nr:hypothetical protein [Flavobacterium sp. '19STA2R22 D10 B1']
MKKIHEILELSIEDYEDMIFNNWVNWCSYHPDQWQMILLDKVILNWFKTEYAKFELEFINKTKRYSDSITITKTDLKKSYDYCTSEINYIYPKILITNLRKHQSPINYPLNIN